MGRSVSENARARLQEYVFLLSRTTSLEAGFALLSSHITNLGFDAVAYSAMPVSIGASGSFKPVFLISRDYSTDFLAHYDEAGLWQQDFTIERIQKGVLDPVDWQQEAGNKVLSGTQQEVVDLAVFEYGIKNALTIPTQSDEHIIAGASIASYINRANFEVLKHEHFAEALQLIKQFHQFVFTNTQTASHFYKPLIDTLTQSQKRVLSFVVKGHLQKHSKEIIGLSPTRTGNILSELYECLDVSNASQLSYLAGRHRLIDMIETLD